MKKQNTNHQKSGAPIDTPTTTGRAKRLGLIGSLGILGGAMLTMGLVSCVGPYDGYGASHTSFYSTGHHVNALPGGYRREVISGSTYYYHDGHYYRQGSGGYVVVEAPRSSRYYNEYSLRQQRQHPSRGYRGTSNRHDTRYQQNQIVTRLPSGHRVVNHRGDTYYQSGDQYYSRQGNGYVIVNRPY